MGGAVALVAGWDLRRRGRRAVFLVLLVAVVGACVLATAAGARRASTALARFKESGRAADVELAAAATPQQVARLRRLPGVAAVASLQAFGLVVPQAPDFQSIGAPDDRAFGTTVDRDRFVAGRAPNPDTVDEATLGEGLANRLGLSVGDRMTAQSYSPEQVAGVLSGESDAGPRAGPHVRLRIVGIVRRPLDLGERGATGGLLVLTPAFAREYRHRIGVFGTRIRIRTDRASDVPRAIDGARRVLGHDFFVAQSLVVDAQGARNAIDVVVLALWVATGVLAVGGLFVIGIVMSRELAARRPVLDRLRELGCTRGQRVAVALVAPLVVVLAGGLLAVGGAIALSPRFPVGIARRADPSVGVHVDWVVTAIGFATVAATVLAVATLAAWRATRLTREQPRRATTTTLAERAAAAGCSPSLANGVRMALDRGRGRDAVPVRSAALGAVVGIVGVTAVMIFTTSLYHLVDSPARYGEAWDFSVMDVTSNTPCGADDFGIPRPGIADLTEVCAQSVEIDGRPVGAFSYARVKGRPMFTTVVAGRAPRASNEVALGAKTLDALHRDVGDVVRVHGRDRVRAYRIVGRAVFPTLGPAQPLADGAAFTAAGYAPIYDQNLFNRYFVGRFTRSADRVEIRRQLAAVSQLGEPAGPSPPVELDRLRQIDWLPISLAALLAVFAVLAVGHGVVTGVRRRRRELALLKTIGFERGQVRATVAWQATTLGLLGVVVGLPVGTLLGVVVWRAVADGLGVADDPAVSLLGLASVVAGTLAVVNLVAWWPARAAARTRPAVVLRSE